MTTKLTKLQLDALNNSVFSLINKHVSDIANYMYDTIEEMCSIMLSNEYEKLDKVPKDNVKFKTLKKLFKIEFNENPERLEIIKKISDIESVMRHEVHFQTFLMTSRRLFLELENEVISRIEDIILEGDNGTLVEQKDQIIEIIGFEYSDIKIDATAKVEEMSKQMFKDI